MEMIVDGNDAEIEQKPPLPEADELTEIESSLLRYIKSMTQAVGKVFQG
jgi:hypothetical protein